MGGVVYARGIGSVKSGSFAWSRVVSLKAKPMASRNVDGLLDRIEDDVRSGASIALGFEAPLFMPVPLCSSEYSNL